MTCSNNTCGTGLGIVVLPSDPDNVVFINAAGTFGGVDITWSYPTVNPHAVAYVVLYRSTTMSFNTAIEIARVGGNHYYDKVEPEVDTTYYYWIIIVSINGTEGSVIGPASAVARPYIDQIISKLANKIHEGTLASELRSQIARIEDIQTDLLTEIANRTDGDVNLQSVLTLVQSSADDATAAVGDLIVAIADNNYAFATSIQSVRTELNDNIASAQTSMETSIDAITGELSAIYTAKVDVNGFVGGFGIHGTTTNVEAIFDVDTFAVGRYDPETEISKSSYPFIINEAGEVLIKNALIADAAITNAKIGDLSVDRIKIASNSVSDKGAAYCSIVAVDNQTNASALTDLLTLTVPVVAGVTVFIEAQILYRTGDYSGYLFNPGDSHSLIAYVTPGALQVRGNVITNIQNNIIGANYINISDSYVSNRTEDKTFTLKVQARTFNSSNALVNTKAWIYYAQLRIISLIK